MWSSLVPALRGALPSALLLGLVLALATPAFAGRAREGAAEITPPPGWTRVTDADGARHVAPDKRAAFTVGRAAPFSGDLGPVLDAELAKAAQLPQYRLETRQAGGKHDRSGGAWNGAVYTYADPARNAFAYVWVIVVGAGGRAVPVTATFVDRPAFDALGGAVLKAANEMTLTTTVVLEGGASPLTRYAMDEATDFVEWLLQTPLTVGQRATLEAEIRGYWKTRNQTEIDGILELLTARDQLAALKPAERDLARQAVLDEGIKEWRKDRTSPTAKMLVGIYDAAHKPIAKGAPPLTRQSVDAFVEFMFFAAAQAAGAPEVTPAAELKARFAADVAKGYKKLPRAQRELIAQMPLVWAALRVSWPDLPADQKAQYIAGWKSTPALAQLGAALDPAKQPAPRVAAASSSSSGKKLSASESAQLQQDMMRNQMALQAQQQHFQMMQQMMRSQFESQMIMNSNLGGNTSYSYRW